MRTVDAGGQYLPQGDDVRLGLSARDLRLYVVGAPPVAIEPGEAGCAQRHGRPCEYDETTRGTTIVLVCRRVSEADAEPDADA